MSSPARLFVCLSTAVFLHATVAAAQVGSSAPRPEPVSPGGVSRTTLAAACPTFSWAPTQWAVAYELVVYQVERPSGLKGAPALRASLPAGASGWTPSVADCLRPGGDYVWFIREVGRKGEAVGTWSDGMAFSVVNAAQPVQAAAG